MRRFVQALSGVESLPGIPDAVGSSLRALPERYNVGIRDVAGVLHAEEGRWTVATMRWGLVPSWEKQPETRYSTQTARLDRAAKSRMFRRAWAQRRCVLAINGYYKWEREHTPRWPWFIQSAQGGVLYAAGLWERWEKDDATPLDSFAVLTFPNAAIPAPLTPDGPLFLPASALDDWLRAPPGLLSRWLLKLRQPDLEAYPVARRVANRKLDDYTLLEPVDPASRTEAEDAASYDDEDAEDEP